MLRLHKVTGLALLGSLCLGCPLPTPANGLEYSYYYMASTAGIDLLCEKISPAVTQRPFAVSAGDEIHYLRSRCFFAVAIRSRDQSLCDQVRTAHSLFWDGSNISPETCRARIDRGEKVRWGGRIDAELILRLLGYSEDEVMENAGGSSEPWQRAYRALVRSSNGDAKLDTLPDFSRGDRAAMREVQALVPSCSVAGSDERLCMLLECAVIRNRKNASDCYERHRTRATPRVSLH